MEMNVSGRMNSGVSSGEHGEEVEKAQDMENMDKTFPTPYPELNHSEKLLEIGGSSIIILANRETLFEAGR